MWTVLETILLGIVLLYASVSAPGDGHLQLLCVFTYSSLGCRPFLSRIHRALPSGALASGAGLHHLLRRHHTEVVPPPGGLSHPESASLGAARRGPAQVSGHHGLCRHLLHGRLYGLVVGSSRKCAAGEPQGGGHEHLPSAQVGTGHADQRDAHPVLWTAPVHRQSECQHPVPGKMYSQIDCRSFFIN